MNKLIKGLFIYIDAVKDKYRFYAICLVGGLEIN